MRPIDADALITTMHDDYETNDMFYPDSHAEAFGICTNLVKSAPTIEVEPIINAVWHYYINDEGKARWKCVNCGKVCHKNPHDKRRCSICGAHMSMEA